MEWTGRAPAQPAGMRVWEIQIKERTAMPHTSADAISTIGVDTGKHALHLVGLDSRGAIVQQQKVPRSQIVRYLANVPLLPDRDRSRHGNALMGASG
jgi:hypothetical protein